jgi:heme exporter protein A
LCTARKMIALANQPLPAHRQAANKPVTSPTPKPVAVSASALSKWIDDRPILENLSFDIPRGTFVTLLGSNGAGKSTLLKLLSTLTPATTGELHLFGKPVARHAAQLRARIGLIGHQSLLYRDLGARENLIFFGRLYGVSNPGGRADELLAAVGLTDRADDPVKAFSRGMTQRVAVARALVHEPDLLLADEPFDGLDAPSTVIVEQLLCDLHGAGKTVILVNHDVRQSLRLARRALVLRDGQLVIDAPTSELSPAEVVAEMELA